ncbi:hypothetical protein HUJ05_000327 [Dendroctonus ponderosae]|nr:hypothetical protein HUJ05_000327 [Dendroctonus ponderosae]
MASGFPLGTGTTNSITFGSTTITLIKSTSQPQPQPGKFSVVPVSTPASTKASMFGSTGASPTLPATQARFGAPSTATGVFGTPAASTAPTLSFGTPTAGSGLFAAPATNTAPTFGAPNVGTASAAPTLSFGAQNPGAASTVPTLSFGAPPASSASPFGAPTTTTAPPSFGASIGQSNFGLIGSAPLGFGASIANTSAPNAGFGLSSSVSTGSLKLGASTNAPTLNFGLGGLGASSAGASALSAPSSVSVGLGGIASSIQGKTAVATQKDISPKEQTLPNEILQTVESFKDMVKQQKAHSSDISRCSIRDFRRVEQEIDLLTSQLNEVETELQRNRQVAEKLKYDTAKTVQHVEMAQRTHDTPSGLQYENTAPMKFFSNLADDFENSMQSLKLQIETMEKYVKNLKGPYLVSPQDLSMGMKRLHETFVALAGRLQAVHSQVETQKELYMNIRKHLLQDTSNPFEKLENAPAVHMANSNAFALSPPKVASGPTPFSNMAVISVSASPPQQPSGQPPAYPGSFSSQPGTVRNSGYNTSLFLEDVGPVSRQYEITKDPTDWEHVKNLLPATVVPKPLEKTTYPSGWKPQAKDLSDRPYFVPRTKNYMIPCYLKISSLQLKRTTIIRHIEGDIWLLEKEIKEFLAPQFFQPIRSQVNEFAGYIRINGDYVNAVKHFLEQKGY